MNDICILIIEDEKPAARSLLRKLEKFGHRVVEMVHSVEQATSWLSHHEEPDLIFMDIQLSDGLSFDILETHPVRSALIFTTAYDEFALKAFKHNSIDYLLKPIVEDELKFAVDKFLEQQKRQPKFDLLGLKNLLSSHTNTYKDRFTIKIGQNLKVVDVSMVECFYSENKGTYLYTTDCSDYLMDQTLDQLEKVLNPSVFFRINRSHIVNIQSIRDIMIHSNSRLKVVLNHYPSRDLIVSREKVSDFKKWLG